MPRFFLDLHNGTGDSRDDEGVEFPDQPAARIAAIESIRSIVSEETREGMLDLNGYIDVFDEARNRLLHVTFMEAFDVAVPPDGERI